MDENKHVVSSTDGRVAVFDNDPAAAVEIAKRLTKAGIEAEVMRDPSATEFANQLERMTVSNGTPGHGLSLASGAPEGVMQRPGREAMHQRLLKRREILLWNQEVENKKMDKQFSKSSKVRKNELRKLKASR